MGLFSSKKIEEKQLDIAPAAPPAPPAAPTPASGARMSHSASINGTKVGIDHAIGLMRSLPTDKDVDLVVTVLKTTLESLGIRVTDIVQDAVTRERDIEARVAQLKGEIAALEKEVDIRVQEITKMESAHAETVRVREYLDSDGIEITKVEPLT